MSVCVIALMQVTTVYDELLARVNFVLKCFGGLNIGGYHTHACIYLCKNIIGGLNIGYVIQKLLIAKIYSSPIFFFLYDT